MTTWVSEAWATALLAPLPVFGRVLGLLVGMPFMGQRAVPVQAKVSLAILLTALFSPLVSVPGVLNPLQRAALFGEELVVGLAMGLVVRMVFAAVQVSGQFVEVPMGLGMSQVLDVAGAGRVPLFGQFYYFLVAQVFFAFNGHLAVFRALADSFRLIPPGSAIWGAGVGETLVHSFAEMFLAGVRMALPVLVAVFVTDAALAIANRAVPQLSLFTVGFPLKTTVGIVAAMGALPFLVQYAVKLFGENGGLLLQLYSLVRGLG
jgi:flagellar biosynthetic protein FliR